MRSSTRKVGWALVGGSVATQLILCWLGLFKGPLLESHSRSIGSITTTTEVYESRWPLWLTLVLLGGVTCGVIIILLSRREDTNG